MRVSTRDACLQLGSAHEKAALAEAEIREAVAGEMDELLKDMDASYKASLPSSWCYIQFCTMRALSPYLPLPEAVADYHRNLQLHEQI